jgi:hypothetical protein
MLKIFSDDRHLSNIRKLRKMKERSLCEKKEERKKQTRERRVLLRLRLFLLLPARFAPVPRVLAVRESLSFAIGGSRTLA